MKKSLLLIAVCTIAFFVTGCMSTHTNDATAVAKVQITTKKFEADIVAGKKAVKGTATIHNVFGIFTWGVSKFADDAFVTTNALPFQVGVLPTTIVKQAATYNACAANKADFILAAKYKMDIKDFFVYKQIKCDVTGYPATIKGVK